MTHRAPALLLLVLAMLMPSSAATAGEPQATSRNVRGVVELFTSQGCSSCPPAEAILNTLSKDPGIVALAYHVDYWDYIGWKDPHGSRANTERQRAYSKAFSNGTIYTPQAIVNGQRDVVGSRAGEIDKAVAETTLRDTPATVDLALRGDRLHISANGPPMLPGGRSTVLMLITYDQSTRTEVSGGENDGMTLVNAHAVRDWRILGMLESKELSVDIPLALLKREGGGQTGYAAVLQTVTEKGAPGPIIAAAALEF